MLITRVSQLTGNASTRWLPITDEQLREYAEGGLVQNVFPHLDAGDREFLMTGITEQEWSELLGSEA